MHFMHSSEACQTSYEDVSFKVQTNLNYGLTSKEAEDRRSFSGYNEFEIAEEDPLWKKYLDQVLFFFFFC